MKEFVGKDIKTLRTPALIVDRSRFKENCERVTKETERRGMGFRAHVKSESGCGRWIWYLDCLSCRGALRDRALDDAMT